jgi:hypothetical protein
MPKLKWVTSGGLSGGFFKYPIIDFLDHKSQESTTRRVLQTYDISEEDAQLTLDALKEKYPLTVKDDRKGPSPPTESVVQPPAIRLVPSSE